MSTLANRPNTAVLVIDVQNGVVANGHNRDEVVANINSVVTKARAADVPVVWIQHDAEDVPKGKRRTGRSCRTGPERRRAGRSRSGGDSFEATDLEKVLAGLGVGSLVITGAQTDACVRSTLHGAVARGTTRRRWLAMRIPRRLQRIRDALPPADKAIAHTNYVLEVSAGSRSHVGVLAAEEIDFGSNA